MGVKNKTLIMTMRRRLRLSVRNMLRKLRVVRSPREKQNRTNK